MSNLKYSEFFGTFSFSLKTKLVGYYSWWGIAELNTSESAQWTFFFHSEKTIFHFPLKAFCLRILICYLSKVFNRKLKKEILISRINLIAILFTILIWLNERTVCNVNDIRWKVFRDNFLMFFLVAPFWVLKTDQQV